MASPSSPVHSTPPLPPPLPDPPSALPLALAVQPPPSTSSRRLPPPCWSPDETLALIDSYREKWYSLGRGNLKATHWQEVADAVSARCPNASPSKTPVQCRHKMEKLRKRYRTEIQRARSLPLSRFNSSWIHFKLMDSMEKGPNPPKSEKNDSDNSHDGGVDRDNDEDDEDLYQEIKNGHGQGHAYGSATRSLNKLYRNGFGGSHGGGGGGGGGGNGDRGSGGFRIRIPTGFNIPQPQPVSKVYGKVVNQKTNPNLMNQNPNSSSGVPNYNHGGATAARAVTGKKRERERDPVGEVVSAIKVLGDGFVRMEQMKMEMAREIETMRMEMEMKRTEMILASQHRIVEAFAKAVSEKNKKNKPNRMNEQQPLQQEQNQQQQP